MSVVAWDGYTLASDQQLTSGSGTTLKGPAKIGRFEGDSEQYSVLWGIVGNYSYGMRMLAWFMGDDDAIFPDKSFPEQEAQLLVMRTDKDTLQVFSDDTFPVHLPIDTPFAMGTGTKAALGAMYAGVGAERAAEIACELDDGCGKGVITETLDDKTHALN